MELENTFTEDDTTETRIAKLNALAGLDLSLNIDGPRLHLVNGPERTYYTGNFDNTAELFQWTAAFALGYRLRARHSHMTAALSFVRGNRIVNFLNELLEIDPAAVSALIAARVPCNQFLADHPTVQIGEERGEFRVGLLGLLNGLCGTRENGYGFINAIYDGDADQLGNLVRFEVHTDEPKEST